MHPMDVEAMPVASLKPYSRNARTHSRKQVRQIAKSIQRFGFTSPVLVSDDNEIVAGHGRVEAAKLLGHATVPTLRLSHLNAAERRAYVIADNKLALNAGWDRELLAIELQVLIDVDFDLELTGFSLAEVDLVLDEAQESSTTGSTATDDGVPPLADAASAVSQAGDLWQLGRHRLLCGDSQNAQTLDVLMNGERADHRRSTDRPLRAAGRIRSSLLRPDHPALRGAHGQASSSCRNSIEFRTDRGAARTRLTRSGPGGARTKLGAAFQ